MATAEEPGGSKFSIPNILPDELVEFQRSHFSTEAVGIFSKEFIAPPLQTESFSQQHYDDWEAEDDGLGYYEDGVKRTLTDEQIEIFRHSELRDLQRAQEKETKSAGVPNSSAEQSLLKRAASSNQPSKTRSGKKKKSSKKQSPQFKREPKPDLRKRTWDVVESGLDTLEYD